MCALSIVLLLTTSALAGCVGDSGSDDIDIAGTSWMLTDMDMMSEPYGMELITIMTFSEDGSIEDFLLNTTSEGCPIGTVSHTEDESLCALDMSFSIKKEWRINDNGHLIISAVMVMRGDDFEMEMDEVTCNMMVGMTVEDEYMSHYSIENTVNWLDDENACEIGSEMKMTLILDDGNLVYHVVHPVMEDDMLVMACTVGIEWTGQTEWSESELATIQSLFSRCPAAIPYGAVVWDCRLDVRLDSLPDLSAQSFNDSASEHPGYPEWCGTIVPENLSLDGSASNLPPTEEFYGMNDGYGVFSRSGAKWMHYWVAQEDCSGLGGTWDEDYSMCSVPVDCIPEADSQLIYEECLDPPYARYHWSGDYLYIGKPSNSYGNTVLIQ